MARRNRLVISLKIRRAKLECRRGARCVIPLQCVKSKIGNEKRPLWFWEGDASGIDDLRVLSFDHIDKDGYLHKRKRGLSTMYRRVIAGTCEENLRVLCHNCNHLHRISDSPHYVHFTQEAV